MNNKDNILSAWLVLEQLSEGIINKKSQSMEIIDTSDENWYNFFHNFLENQKEKFNISEENFKKSGLVLYFDIFYFDEVKKILTKIYDIEPTFEELTNSEKFTFAIFFDNELRFIPEKFFFTISGYIKHYGNFPNDINQFEGNLKSKLINKFSNDFNQTISELFIEYNIFDVLHDSFRYSFVRNVDNENVHLHSFFTDDLQKAKSIKNSKNLNTYFSTKISKRLNLNPQKKESGFNPKLFNKLLKPKFYPLGRFPSNTEYPLSLMQQLAVNVCVNNFTNMQSINGPPGTGKTTLLKDVFADLIVKQAYAICRMKNKKIKKSVTFDTGLKLDILHNSIAKHNIIVASSNNGAVQNIVKELPKIDGIDDNLKELLLEADYFTDVSNLEIKNNNKKTSNTKVLNEENWGLFSIEGGSKSNIRNLLNRLEHIIDYLKTEYKSDTFIYEEFFKKYKSVKKKRKKLKKFFQKINFNQSYPDFQKSNPWSTKEFRIQQSELFIMALKVRKQFLFNNKKNLEISNEIWKNEQLYLEIEDSEKIFNISWQWLNFAIPVISTTFASFGRMFNTLGANSISNLFIDEAGQALPQASIGAIFRSKKILAVGDPLQIKPVLTIDSNMLRMLGKKYAVDQNFISANTSTQSIIDKKSKYGFYKNEDEWIGIPLWVHRRSNYPMFTISNEISYNGLMVQGKPDNISKGKSEWFDIKGIANDKFVYDQAIFLKNEIQNRMKENPELKDDIYVITPFRNIAYKLIHILDEINFTKRDKGKPTNIGTVHTFQGKESKIVYFILGADENSKGAAMWAVSEPNLMNVAATRAKEEFYIIGDKTLYSTLGSKIANKTIKIIDIYNQ